MCCSSIRLPMLDVTSSERVKVRPLRYDSTLAQSHGWHQAHRDGGLTCRAGKLHEKRRARGAMMGDSDGVRRHRAPRAPTAIAMQRTQRLMSSPWGSFPSCVVVAPGFSLSPCSVSLKADVLPWGCSPRASSCAPEKFRNEVKLPRRLCLSVCLPWGCTPRA